MSDPAMSMHKEFQHAYAVIMAGGSGTRFWPLSRRKHPKQLLQLFGKGTLLEQAVARVEPVIPTKRIYVYTNEVVHPEVARLLPRLPQRNIVAEPASRNTAPTIGLAAQDILQQDPNGVMVVLTADHVITQPDVFRRTLRAACRVAATPGRSVVLGIKPTRPDTGYGYIRLGAPWKKIAGQTVYTVEKFTEKPPLKTARRYLASGRYLWNSGMFVWRADTLWRNLEEYQPAMAAQLTKLAAAGGLDAPTALKRIFPRLEKISIDYALLEKISNIFAVAASFGWSDVGSWAVVHELEAKDADSNVRPKESLCIDSSGNMIYAEGKRVVTLGVQDLVIVETQDALLVCARDRSQEVGKAVEELERRGLKHLL